MHTWLRTSCLARSLTANRCVSRPTYYSSVFSFWYFSTPLYHRHSSLVKMSEVNGITVIAVFCRNRFSRLRFAALHQCLRESMCSARQNVKSHICVLKRVQQTCSQTKFSVQCTVYIFTQWMIVFNVSVWLVLSLSCTLSMTTLWVHCPQSSILSGLVKE